MPLIVKAPESNFKPAPEGTHPAVCVDVIDLGMVESQWGSKHCCEVVWEIDENDPETGERYMAKKRYTLSLSEKANLYSDLMSWRGRAFTQEELRGFDLENVIGKSCMVQVIHKIGSQGGVFANVKSVTGLPKKMAAVEPSGKYTRKCAREVVEADDVPF